MNDRVRIDVHEHVATVTLDRADKMNAMDTAMFEALPEAAAAVAARGDVRAVVLTGSGGNFSAGIDIAGFGGQDIAGRFANEAFALCGDTPANRYQHPTWCWYALPMPVIAAIEGVCFGAGVQVASGADVRIAAPDAKLSIMEIKWGLVPDMAMTATLRGVIPLDRLKMLAYTGQIVDGAQAAALGLVTQATPDPLAVAQTLAAKIAGRSPDAIRATKHLCNEAFESDRGEALRLEAAAQLSVMGTPNQLEAAMANLQKRAPDFKDPGAAASDAAA
ncbi:MAG: crotonase/enoyl-CoA hydratase family protein [Pseudomonadota bacterium]